MKFLVSAFILFLIGCAMAGTLNIPDYPLITVDYQKKCPTYDACLKNYGFPPGQHSSKCQEDCAKNFRKAQKEEFEGDWKIHISNLNTELTEFKNSFAAEKTKVAKLSERLEKKENEIKILKGRLDQLEKRSVDTNKEASMDLMEVEKKEANLKQMITNQINKTLEQRIQNFPSVVFLAVKNRYCHNSCPSGYITYDVVEVDNAGCFDKDTGTFVAPTDGTYVFLFNAFVATSNGTTVLVSVNGLETEYFYSGDMGANGHRDGRQLNAFWSLKLVKGDTLRLLNSSRSSIYISFTESLYFMGLLLN